MNKEWLLENADTPIKSILLCENTDSEKLYQNDEVKYWLSRIRERSQAEQIGAIHGSHDYRMENILGKCWILGLSKEHNIFDECMKFIRDYLDNHILLTPPDELSFGKLYHYRDKEKVLACFLPLLGYYEESSIQRITQQRIDILYAFTKKKDYNIYVDGSKLKGVKKEWQPYIINPELYADGNISLPDMHDYLLFAGMYPFLSNDNRSKVENIVQWLFEPGYEDLYRRYGYFYAPGGSYDTKAIIFNVKLPDFKNMIFDKGDLVSLLFNVYILSYFESARKSLWFAQALDYLEQYRNKENRYKFPSNLITEKTDSFVIFGGHMNVGENKKQKLYSEIVSTYWMERIEMNLSKEEIRQ